MPGGALIAVLKSDFNTLSPTTGSVLPSVLLLLLLPLWSLCFCAFQDAPPPEGSCLLLRDCYSGSWLRKQKRRENSIFMLLLQFQVGGDRLNLRSKAYALWFLIGVTSGPYPLVTANTGDDSY